MYPGHPWEGEEYGPAEYEWFLARNYELDILFKVDLRPFLKFCKDFSHRSQELTMKIGARLSQAHLPQYMLGLNGKVYATRYPVGYVRPVRPGADMLEHIAIREERVQFAERDIRAKWKPIVKYMARKHPKISVFMARHFFGYRETRNNYALMVSRNALRGLGSGVTYFGTHYRTMCLGIPFGEKVDCLFSAPHAFGNIKFFEPFLSRFKSYMEDPEQIPEDLLGKPYAKV
jgi:hypothetical protein